MDYCSDPERHPLNSQFRAFGILSFFSSTFESSENLFLKSILLQKGNSKQRIPDTRDMHTAKNYYTFYKNACLDCVHVQYQYRCLDITVNKYYMQDSEMSFSLAINFAFPWHKNI